MAPAVSAVSPVSAVSCSPRQSGPSSPAPCSTPAPAMTEDNSTTVEDTGLSGTTSDAAQDDITARHPVSIFFTEVKKYVSSHKSPPGRCIGKQMYFKVSPFTLTILMGGALLCILIFFGFCLVAR